MELGQLFVDEGLISTDQLTLARGEQNGGRIDQTLIKMGLITCLLYTSPSPRDRG